MPVFNKKAFYALLAELSGHDTFEVESRRPPMASGQTMLVVPM